MMIVPLVQKATRRSLLSLHTAVESDQWCPEWYCLIPADSGVGDQWHGLWLTTTSWATFGIGWGNPESKHSLVDDTGCWQCFSTYDVARVLLCFDGKTGPLSCADSFACGWGEGVQVSSMDNEIFSSVKSKTLWEQFHQLMPGIYLAIPTTYYSYRKRWDSPYDGLLPFPDPQDLPMY